MEPWTADGGCPGWWSTGTHIHTERHSLVEYWDTHTHTHSLVHDEVQGQEMVDVQVGGVLGHTHRHRDTHRGHRLEVMDVQVVEYWETHTHTNGDTHLYMMGSMDCRWWLSMLVEYWDTHTQTETLTCT